jgi:periplasmic divalent cation tolerance protein
MTNLRIVYVTAPNRQEAQKIAKQVVEERLAACANILGDIESFYHWDNQLENSREVAFFLKTTVEYEAMLIERIKELHSYSCPAIITIPIASGFQPFLDWVVAETKPVLSRT